MKKIVLLSVLAVLVCGGAVFAKADKQSTLPDAALKRLPLVEKITFVHYKKDFARPAKECGNGICEPGENINKCPADCSEGDTPVDDSGCYTFLSKGLYIKSPKNLTINPELNVVSILASAWEWDDSVSNELFGNYNLDATADWDEYSPDGRNEFSYGDYPQDGVIAVARVWGYYSVPPWAREITEFDIMFDTDFTWGDADANSSVMDLQNIATHEIGHAVGMGDLYEGVCSEATMYGYSSYGEIKKRTLEQCDIFGLQKLYGN